MMISVNSSLLTYPKTVCNREMILRCTNLSLLSRQCQTEKKGGKTSKTPILRKFKRLSDPMNTSVSKMVKVIMVSLHCSNSNIALLSPHISLAHTYIHLPFARALRYR